MNLSRSPRSGSLPQESKVARDAKYGFLKIDGIPDDEPVFIIRAKDACAPQTIRQYAENAARSGSPAEHHSSARRQADAIQSWQTENEDKVKTPD